MNSEDPLKASPSTRHKGIHTGEEGDILIEANSLSSLKIIIEELGDFEIPNARDLIITANNGTVLTNQQGKSFFTPEHLLAAVLPFSSQPLTVKVVGPEVVIGDGSSLPFLLALGNALESNPKATSPEFVTYDSNLSKDYSVNSVKFKVTPAETFSVSYKYSRDGHEEEFVFSLASEFALQTYFEDILPARTFISWKEYEQALRNHILKGATPESGILLAGSAGEYFEISTNFALPYLEDYPYLNRKGFRMSQELAKHKILDLMGDLALLNLALPKLKIEITNGGHFHNHLLLKDLIHEQSNK